MLSSRESHNLAHRRSVVHAAVKRSAFHSPTTAAATAAAPTARLSTRVLPPAVSIVTGGTIQSDPDCSGDESEASTSTSVAISEARVTVVLRHFSGDASLGSQSVSKCGRQGQWPRCPVAFALMAVAALIVAGAIVISFDFFFKGVRSVSSLLFRHLPS